MLEPCGYFVEYDRAVSEVVVRFPLSVFPFGLFLPSYNLGVLKCDRSVEAELLAPVGFLLLRWNIFGMWDLFSQRRLRTSRAFLPRAGSRVQLSLVGVCIADLFAGACVRKLLTKERCKTSALTQRSSRT